jgi:hypothetical protein
MTSLGPGPAVTGWETPRQWSLSRTQQHSRQDSTELHSRSGTRRSAEYRLCLFQHYRHDLKQILLPFYPWFHSAIGVLVVCFYWKPITSGPLREKRYWSHYCQWMQGKPRMCCWLLQNLPMYYEYPQPHARNVGHAHARSHAQRLRRLAKPRCCWVIRAVDARENPNQTKSQPPIRAWTDAPPFPRFVSFYKQAFIYTYTAPALPWAVLSTSKRTSWKLKPNDNVERERERE